MMGAPPFLTGRFFMFVALFLFCSCFLYFLVLLLLIKIFRQEAKLLVEALGKVAGAGEAHHVAHLVHL